MTGLTLHIAEGEKCADALWEVGLVATTSQGGSGRAAETDWAPAAQFERVFIWQDVDRTCAKTGINPGVKYAEMVAGLIRVAAADGGTSGAGLKPATQPSGVRIPDVDLPVILIVELGRFWGNSEANYGRDVFDLIADWRTEGKSNEEIAAGLVAIAEGYWRAPGTAEALALCGKDFSRKGGDQNGNIHSDASRRDRKGGARSTDQSREESNSDNTRDSRRLRSVLMPQEYQAKPMGLDPVARAGREGLELTNLDGALGLAVDEIYRRLTVVCEGWPARVRSPGAKHPLLFIDYGRSLPKDTPRSASAERFGDLEGTQSRFSELLPGPIVPERIRWIGSGDNFKCWLHERTRLKFKDKLDASGANFVSVNDLYQYCGNSRSPEYKAVECRPHWPPIPGHYYAWEKPENYVPDGTALRGLLGFFNNCKDNISLTVALAAIMTPGWGVGGSQPYGRKPMIVFQAPDRGCGKTTLAECISKIWNGHLSIDLSGRDQDELVQRLLTPEALTKRIGILDNVKGTLSSSVLEWLVTTALISGKRLYSGDASRPNTINYFITMNGPSCSSDVALRSYFVELQKPVYSTQWDERLAEYVADRGCDIVADVGWLMCQDVRKPPTVVDRWPLWGWEVLSRAADFIGCDVDAVMRRTRELRNECDDEQDECNELMAGILKLVAGAEGGGGNGKKAYQHSRSLIRMEMETPMVEKLKVVDVKAPIFISSTEMAEIWREVLGGKLRPRQIWKVILNYLMAGKLPHLSVARNNASNGYILSMEAMNAYLDEYRKSLESREVTTNSESYS